MAIINFNLVNVFNTLKEKGKVYTIRKKRTVHRGYVTVMFRRRKVGEAIIDEVGKVNVDEGTVNGQSLEKYLPFSGFESVKDWVDVARMLHGRCEDLYLYEVIWVEEDKRKFKLGKYEVMVYEFLKKHRGRRFTVQKLCLELGVSDVKKLLKATKSLARKGLINRVTIDTGRERVIVWVD